MNSTSSTAPPLGETATGFLQSIEEMIRGERPLADVLGLTQEDIRELAEEGDTLLEAGRLTEARYVYEGCAALSPADWSLFHRLGLCCAAQGEVALSRTCLEAARELESGEA